MFTTGTVIYRLSTIRDDRNWRFTVKVKDESTGSS